MVNCGHIFFCAVLCPSVIISLSLALSKNIYWSKRGNRLWCGGGPESSFQRWKHAEQSQVLQPAPAPCLWKRDMCNNQQEKTEKKTTGKKNTPCYPNTQQALLNLSNKSSKIHPCFRQNKIPRNQWGTTTPKGWFKSNLKHHLHLRALCWVHSVAFLSAYHFLRVVGGLACWLARVPLVLA